LQGCKEHGVEAKFIAPSGAMKTKWILLYEENKNPIKSMIGTIIGKTKRKAKERPNDV
jgi:hypothetical protein